jgi:hypothetical protein
MARMLIKPVRNDAVLGSNNPFGFWHQGNHGVVGRDLSRQVGLKPDLRVNGQSGLISGVVPERFNG